MKKIMFAFLALGILVVACSKEEEQQQMVVEKAPVSFSKSGLNNDVWQAQFIASFEFKGWYLDLQNSNLSTPQCSPGIGICEGKQKKTNVEVGISYATAYPWHKMFCNLGNYEIAEVLENCPSILGSGFSNDEKADIINGLVNHTIQIVPAHSNVLYPAVNQVQLYCIIPAYQKLAADYSNAIYVLQYTHDD